MSQPLADDGIPRRVILLGNRLPGCVLANGTKEPMWDTLFAEKNQASLDSTVVVTSLERLRHEGIKVSRRLSWDATVEDLQREFTSSDVLKRLSRIGHLIIRIGLVGAMHCFRDKRGELEIRFIYDPKAEHGIYRDRTLQGNAFGIRSALPACLAFQLLLLAKSLPVGAATAMATAGAMKAIRSSIVDGISLIQEFYKAGFGTTWQELKQFIADPKEREVKIRVRCHNAQRTNLE